MIYQDETLTTFFAPKGDENLFVNQDEPEEETPDEEDEETPVEKEKDIEEPETDDEELE